MRWPERALSTPACRAPSTSRLRTGQVHQEWQSDHRASPPDGTHATRIHQDRRRLPGDGGFTSHRRPFPTLSLTARAGRGSGTAPLLPSPHTRALRRRSQSRQPRLGDNPVGPEFGSLDRSIFTQFDGRQIYTPWLGTLLPVAGHPGARAQPRSRSGWYRSLSGSC